MYPSPSLPQPNAAGTGSSGQPRRRRAAVVLGLNLHQPLAWWMDPIRVVIFVVLPLFCFAAYYNHLNYWSFNASRDFVTPQTFGLGLYSMALLILGMVGGKLMVRRQDTVSLIDGERVTRTLLWMGWVAIVAYVLLLGTLVVNFSLVLALLRGDAAASGELRNALGRIPGVTSLVQFGTVYLALVSTLVTMANFTMTKRLWVMTGVIFLFCFARSILNSERIALLEALAAIGVIPLAYRWRPSLWRTVAPYLGVLLVFLFFAAGEYFRSWQFYRSQYPSYLDFITQRFFGYFSTAINNGAGAYVVYGQSAPHPEITVGWVTRFPVIGSMLFPTPDISVHDDFLEKYLTLEFNNPGGFYAAFLDYNFATASIFMVAVGCAVGAVYRCFQNKMLVGMLLYPVVFLGTTDLIRILYISDTRTLPILLGVCAAIYSIRPTQGPRDTLLSRISLQGQRA